MCCHVVLLSSLSSVMVGFVCVLSRCIAQFTVFCHGRFCVCCHVVLLSSLSSVMVGFVCVVTLYCSVHCLLSW